MNYSSSGGSLLYMQHMVFIMHLHRHVCDRKTRKFIMSWQPVLLGSVREVATRHMNQSLSDMVFWDIHIVVQKTGISVW